MIGRRDGAPDGRRDAPRLDKPWRDPGKPHLLGELAGGFGVQPACHVYVARALGLGRQAAELAPGALPGVIGSQSAGHEIVGALGHMERQLAIDVAPEAARTEDVEQTMKPGHRGTPVVVSQQPTAFS